MSPSSGVSRSPGSPSTSDTRGRIQHVALELFTANGYEATSLREIAESLGVTKAALYYHFRTKDDIIQSLVDDLGAHVEELITWANDQPRTSGTRREFLQRYSEMLYEHNHHRLMRFFDRNQSSMAQHKSGAAMRERMRRLHELVVDPQAPLAQQIRSSLAIVALHLTWLAIRDPGVTDDQRRRAALDVALDLIE